MVVNLVVKSNLIESVVIYWLNPGVFLLSWFLVQGLIARIRPAFQTGNGGEM